MKKLKFIVLSGFIALLFIAGSNFVHADSANFTVHPNIGENQVDESFGYFNVLLKPKQSQLLTFTLYNNKTEPIKVSTTFGTAFTSQSGNPGYTPDLVKPDPSLKINLKDYVTLPRDVTIPAKSSVIISSRLTMPDQLFSGVIAGGFNFEAVSSASDNAQKNGVSITNKYRYVYGLVAQNSLNKVDPVLTLGHVGANQVNQRNVITAHLTNTEAAYLMQMNTDATVTKYGDKKLNYSYHNAMMEMAPQSSFDLAIPVSIQGVLNGKTSEPLKPGKYHLKMVVFGGKDDKGNYQTLLNGKVTNYDYQWTFEKDFRITGALASTLNKKDATVQKFTIDWLLLIGFAIIFILLFIIIILLFKRRKNEDDTVKKE